MRRQLEWFDNLCRTWAIINCWINDCHMVNFLRHRVSKSRWVKLIGRTFLKWQQDECLEMGAALAYYAVFSLFPLILVSLSIVGFLLGPDTGAYDQILKVARDALPPDAYQVVQATLLQLHTGSTSASIIGFVILLFIASGFFGALSRSFDKIWHVHPRHRNTNDVRDIALNFIWQRLFAFLLVIGASGLVFASMLSNIALDTLQRLLEGVNNHVTRFTIDQLQLLPWFRVGGAFITLTLVVMLLYKILPSTRVAWRDIWPGAIFTAVLWIILQQLISNSVISLGSRFRSYGVIGGVMVLMLWIYLTSQIFFLGGELTYTYAYLFGSRRHHHRLTSKPGHVETSPAADPNAPRS
jgi:membrane protein